MNVLSLFDGMSCGQIALDKLGIKVDNYFSSEIDKYAMQVTQNNYPNTEQVGDVTNLDGSYFTEIDLLIGGSPCQDFSQANLKGKGLNGSRSGLFYEFYYLLEEIKPKYFLLENVKMKKEYQDVITNLLGVNPIEINSGLVSAQNRRRLYWTNIPNVTQPKDKSLFVSDILDDEPFELFTDDRIEKTKVKTKNYIQYDLKNKGKKSQDQRAYFKSSKMCTLPKSSLKSKTNVIEDFDKGIYRKLSPNEIERLQTVPIDYTKGVSDTQRYQMLGNGWTVDVIAHIFKNIK